MYVNGRNGVCVRVKNQVFENRETNKVDTNGRFDSIHFEWHETERKKKGNETNERHGMVRNGTERNGIRIE
ncbi:MAG: hypothetical protein ACI90V_011714 [Bacillariaceae sp.]|jgi:hypothetical protein